MVDAQGTSVASGLVNLVVLKTTESGFAGFPRDRYTTLPATQDRILATSVTASWRYRPGMTDYGVRARVRQALVETFALHQSRSVQHTSTRWPKARSRRCGDITEVTLRLPNRHHELANLTPFGLDNPNEVFIPTEEPYGLIEATIKRS